MGLSVSGICRDVAAWLARLALLALFGRTHGVEFDGGGVCSWGCWRNQDWPAATSTAKLFIARVNMSAAGADAAVEDGAALLLNVSIIELNVRVIAALLIAVFSIVIVRQRRVRAKI